MVLSASPTLTGTLTAAAANFSGKVAANGATAGSNALSAKAGGNTYVAGGLRLDGAVSGSSYITDIGGALYFSNDGSTDQMVLTSGGNLGIGMTPSNVLDITQGTTGTATANITNSTSGTSARAAFQVTSSSGQYANLQVLSAGYTTSGIFTANSGIVSANSDLGLCSLNGVIKFAANGTAEVARFDTSGNLLVGATSTTAAQSGGIAMLPAGNQSYLYAGHVSGTSSGAYFFGCYYNAVLCGGITQSGTTGVALTSISDYRLKDNVKPMIGGLDKITALKPVTYEWISDKSSGEGFIAHELQAVIPVAVVGEKDAVDENGGIKPQGVDFSKIVPHLVAAIQELTARLAALESK